MVQGVRRPGTLPGNGCAAARCGYAAFAVCAVRASPDYTARPCLPLQVAPGTGAPDGIPSDCGAAVFEPVPWQDVVGSGRARDRASGRVSRGPALGVMYREVGQSGYWGSPIPLWTR